MVPIMEEEVFGLTRGAVRLVNDMADDFRQRLPPVGRRTRRVWNRAHGGTLLVGIEIESFDDATGIAVCILTFCPVGRSIVPEEDDYERIEVYDEVYGCLFTESEEALVGRRGTAAYMKATESEDAYAVARWQCMGLCCS